MKVLAGLSLTHNTLMQLMPGVVYLTNEEGEPLQGSVMLAIALQTLDSVSHPYKGLPPIYTQ